MKELLKITIIEGHTKIENNTELDLWIGLRPQKSGERIKDEYRIGSKEFLILLFEMDMGSYCLFWRFPKKAE